MAVVVSLLTSAITFAFAGAVLQQYLRRPRAPMLVWGAALIWYGIATTAQCVAEVGGWSASAFRIWYLTGGLLTAAYLGQGTAFLLLPRRLANGLLALLLLATALGAVRMFSAPLSLREILPPPGRFTPRATSLPADLRALAVVLNLYGTALLVGGAIWSALNYVDHMLDRRRRPAQRLIANLLIAGGAMVVASAGSLEALGREEFLYAGEIAGISIIFLGFLRSRPRGGQPAAERPAERRQPPPPSVATAPRPARSLKRISERARRAGSR